MQPKIIAYRGMASGGRVLVQGHTFRNYRLLDPHPRQGLWHNLREAVKRYTLEALPGAEVEIRYGEQVASARTNKSGYFRCTLSLDQFPGEGWHTYEYRFPGDEVWGTSEFLAARPDTTGVISDIDDTVLISHSTRLFRKFWLILARNAYTRRPSPLIRHWYRLLNDLNEQQVPADYYYVSNSEWNLYDFLIDFFQINGLPKGPFLLKGLRWGAGVVWSKKQESWKISKLERIRFLFDFYPKKSFILVGDSGQRDMHIYAEVVRTFPGRVKGVLIRDVPGWRDEKKIRLHNDFFHHLGVPFIPVGDGE